MELEPPAKGVRADVLAHIEENPDITQASIADQLGVAVGTVNWHIQRLVEKGYIKVKRAQRKKLRYIITPSGIAHRAKLTIDYIEWSMLLYRKTRERVGTLLAEVKEAGYHAACIEVRDQGPDDIRDICRLTCLEHGVEVLEVTGLNEVPVLEVTGSKVFLHLPDRKTN